MVRNGSWDLKDIILMLVVIVVLLFIFKGSAGGVISSLAPITSASSQSACKLGYLGVGGDPGRDCTPKPGDADGDCYPDSCDICPDIHNSLIDYMALKKSINENIFIAIMGDVKIDETSPDRDMDLVPNLCEATQEDVYKEKHKIWNSIKRDEIEFPYKDGKASCKFWYSHDQCCAYQGSWAFGFDGQKTNIALDKSCLRDRPGK